jgi:lambda repressor-like predicted transcriptional regulator
MQLLFENNQIIARVLLRVNKIWTKLFENNQTKHYMVNQHVHPINSSYS